MEEEGTCRGLGENSASSGPCPRGIERRPRAQAPVSSSSPRHTEASALWPWARWGWVVGADLLRVEGAPGAPCKGPSVVSHHAGDTHPSVPGIQIASDSGFSFLPCITVKITIRRVAESTHGASSIFIKIFFVHNVPNLFLCSRYLESHSF